MNSVPYGHILKSERQTKKPYFQIFRISIWIEWLQKGDPNAVITMDIWLFQDDKLYVSRTSKILSMINMCPVIFLIY